MTANPQARGENLQHANAQVVDMVQSLVIGVAVQDREGRIVQWNPATERILGLGPDQFSGAAGIDERWHALRPDGSVLPFDDYPAMVAMRTGEPQRDALVGVCHVNGDKRWVRASSVPLFVDGEAAYAVTSFVDVTEERAASARLQWKLDSERALGQTRHDFAERAGADLDAAIGDSLARFGGLLDADWLTVYVQLVDEPGATKPHRWCRVEEPEPEFPESDPTRELRALQRLGRAVLHITDLDERERALFDARYPGARPATLLSIPLSIEGLLAGSLLCGTRPRREWTDDETALLEQFGVLLASTLVSRSAREALRHNAEFLEAVMDGSFDAVAAIDFEGRVTYANPGAARLAGLPAEELVGQSLGDFAHPEDRDAVLAAVSRVLQDGDAFAPFEARVKHAGGHYVFTECAAHALRRDDEIVGVVVNGRDITDRIRQAAAWSEMQQRFGEVWSHGPAGMAIVSLDGVYLDVNPAHCALTGFSRDQLVGARVSKVVDPEHLDEIVHATLDVTRGRRERATVEIQLRRADGGTAWGSVSVSVVRDDDGEPLHVIALVEDITERRILEERLEFRATHDALTLLPQRALVLELLGHAIAMSGRQGDSVGVLFIDLDQFKRVNDTLGHAAGDRLLQDFAHRLQYAIRIGDVAGRLGGDEFVVVCSKLPGPSAITHVADRVLETVQRPFTIEGVDVFVGASIGIAVGQGDIDAATLLRQADTAAYRSKERGRNRYELFDEELRLQVAARLDTETALRRALERDEFVLHYQPVVDARDGTIRGTEALLRWEREGRGLLLPGEFLDVAEETGLIVPLGARVLELACAQLERWQRLWPGTRVAVNASARQLAQSDFAETVRRALDRSGADPSGLCLEITESSLVHDHHLAVPHLRELQSLGVSIAIDDFGTGFSSLSYLRQLPVDILKVDRSFVLELDEAGDGPTVTAIVASIIRLADSLGKSIVAEGVETERHVQALLALGCPIMQGYYFARPVPAAEATRLLAGPLAAPFPG